MEIPLKENPDSQLPVQYSIEDISALTRKLEEKNSKFSESFSSLNTLIQSIKQVDTSQRAHLIIESPIGKLYDEIYGLLRQIEEITIDQVYFLFHDKKISLNLSNVDKKEITPELLELTKANRRRFWNVWEKISEARRDFTTSSLKFKRDLQRSGLYDDWYSRNF